MKRALPAILALVFASVPLGIGGCGDDSSGPAEPADTSLTDEEVSTTQEITEAVGSIFQILGSVQAAVHDALTQASARSEPATPSCPTVRIDGIGIGHVEVTLDYGSGCSMENGTAASGALHATYATGSPDDSILVDFDNFTIDGSTVEGTLAATGSGMAWTFAFDGTLTDGSTTVALVATLGLVVDTAGTPADPADDMETITGGGTCTADGKSYLLAITQPLVLTSACTYPTTGILTYQLQSDRPTAATSIDFGDGACCTALVTIGSRSETVDLCEEP
jgi:hypothetical protein